MITILFAGDHVQMRIGQCSWSKRRISRSSGKPMTRSDPGDSQQSFGLT
jgi:hypothetical protein